MTMRYPYVPERKDYPEDRAEGTVLQFGFRAVASALVGLFVTIVVNAFKP